MRLNILFGALILVLIIIVLSLTSCYTPSKASRKFDKSVKTFPEIGAAYCAETYPVTTTYIKGDSVVTFDSIYVGDDIIFDTITVNDTLVIVKTKPITKKIFIRSVRVDTQYVTNTAEIALCNITRDKAIQLATDYKKELTKWQSKAKKRFWIIASIAGAGLLWLFLFIREKM